MVKDMLFYKVTFKFYKYLRDENDKLIYDDTTHKPKKSTVSVTSSDVLVSAFNETQAKNIGRNYYQSKIDNKKTQTPAGLSNAELVEVNSVTQYTGYSGHVNIRYISN